jgi:hypothetical protein
LEEAERPPEFAQEFNRMAQGKAIAARGLGTEAIRFAHEILEDRHAVDGIEIVIQRLDEALAEA